jgi:hypothetical protein
VAWHAGPVSARCRAYVATVGTSAADALVIVFNALPADEQDDVFERIHHLRERRDAGEESETARFIRSMRRVAEELGEVPSIGDYKAVSQELRDSA